MISHKALATLSASILLTSCVSTQVASLKPSDSSDIAVYVAGLATPAVTPVLYIEASGGILTTKKQLIRGLKSRAKREPGVDAVVNVRFGYQGFYPFVEGVAATRH